MTNACRIAVVVTSIVAGACVHGDPATETHPDPGVHADSLVFHTFVYPDSAGPNRKLWFIGVTACGDSSANRPAKAVWTVERAESNRSSEPASPYVRFGVAPAAGWTTTVPASRLTAGRYQVRAFGGGIGGAAAFLVDSSGRITSDNRWDFACR